MAAAAFEGAEASEAAGVLAVVVDLEEAAVSGAAISVAETLEAAGDSEAETSAEASASAAATSAEVSDLAAEPAWETAVFAAGKGWTWDNATLAAADASAGMAWTAADVSVPAADWMAAASAAERAGGFRRMDSETGLTDPVRAATNSTRFWDFRQIADCMA